ncbi:alpha/beta hydrolase [Devosia beringensis]|uniref:alpha/beta hydrolase n=1 Tax=Devosia beringensis TaxID=2657486 RepID=UPI00186B7775|nr:alpha/beta hydrolase [Devosia beringensis]
MTDSIPAPGDPQESIGRLAELIGGDPTAGLDADMKAVLDMLTQLGAQRLEQLTPAAARAQPGLPDAVKALMAVAGTVADDDGVASADVTINSAAGDLAARLYRPGELLPRLNPMVLYFHGGGFVTGDLDSHDGSARALARRTGAIVLSVGYRLAPEHAWPAAHDDAWTAWTWLGDQAHRLGGDPRRVAVAGEDAGANLALQVALRARDGRGHRPLHQALIHPMAGTDFSMPSYGETLRTLPVDMPAMRWRLRQIFADGLPEDEPLLNLATRHDLAGLAPASIILARIDPLRSEGELLAAALQRAGVPVSCTIYEGVTQGFFGLGQIVTKALFAQAELADALARAFAPPAR